MKISIRYKFIIGFLCIFYMGYILMSFYLNDVIVDTNNNIIKRSLFSFQKELLLYINEYFESENLSINYLSNKENAKLFAEKLSTKIESRVIVYSHQGEFLSDSANASGIILNYEDLEDQNKDLGQDDVLMAIENKSSFVVVPVKDKYLVVYSSPLIYAGKTVGMVRCVLNYSEVVTSIKDLLKIINTLVIIIFGAIFMFVILLSKKIVEPIEKLTKATKAISKGNFDVEVDTYSKDEVGELAKSFTNMNEQIKEQIKIIESERDNLKKVERFRKSFFDNITHEMKTPLAIISGYCQILIDQNFENRELLHNSIKTIKRESENMHKMILQLLAASKEQSSATLINVEEINLSKNMYSACTDMKIRSDKYQISIEKEIEDNVYCIGNADELRRVMINLLDNSIKYGDVHSTIRVKLFREKSYCHIEIEDKGKGIPLDKLDMIFKRFYRIEQSCSHETEGYGLGLDIVKNIIDKHHGEIQIISKEQIGTTVKVKIPLKVYKTETSV